MFSGSYVAIVTPMLDDGSIDYEAWTGLVEWHASSGTTGLVIGGTTGESPTLLDDELIRLVQAARAAGGDRLRLVAGIGTSSTLATVERARRFADLPLDGVLVVTPAYNKPTQEGLLRHFEAVAEASAAPVILYNVPGRTAIDLLPETTAAVSRVGKVVGIKEAVPDMQRVRSLVAACGKAFAVLSGDDATACDAMAAGARGVISVTANVVPAAMARMVAAALTGDTVRARELDAGLQTLHRELFIEANPIPVKWALHQMGRIGSGVRLPMTLLSQEHHDRVKEALSHAGV